mmetsp:Transcript_134764/g.430632  ORF Transcript_134764/g.430632 Transcript_134764/m.430632 type:complete len:1080 (+) Transcript_134764:67-3306(+)|eukprot:CAMPEP_0203900202 /NCGR_PEP_ID=MMETSP0359-20131031/42502_1 /ASSEMBLY_ACC=CAM_ASM_000338 /TAXON_ID=268821 /ORGANISM="Scrippsiella Hangoei, Strain SHTV-5" /LENGTH=1079 /DNA_ID=CAMNT_0050823609 /DNA_START=25 /DNA_END=3264 /DNA_ORIENTATION=-
MPVGARNWAGLVAAAVFLRSAAAISVSAQGSLRTHQNFGEGAQASNATSFEHFLADVETHVERGVVKPLGFVSSLFGKESAGDWAESQNEAKSAPQCGITKQVTHHDVGDKWARCPDECPVFAQHKDDGLHCDFRCVPATVEACSAMNPLEPIPDLEMGACRACMVTGCDTCREDGTESCQHCSAGYQLTPEGQCQSTFFYAWVAVFLVFSIIAAVLVAWVVSLALTPVTNKAMLQIGLEHRSRSKVLQPKGHDTGGDDASPTSPTSQRRQPWPLTTNLCRTEVAGPGLHLQFNYQLALIIWAATIGIAWYVMVLNVDPELGRLGLHRSGTARQNCIVVAFGWRAQQRLMPYKIIFMIVSYVISFFMAIVFAVYQLQQFQEADAKQTTHKDFCVRCTGLPELKGDAEIEVELKSAVTEATGKQVVGVSVCWDYDEHKSEFTQVIEDDLAERSHAARTHKLERRGSAAAIPRDSETDADSAQAEERSCWAFRKVEDFVFSDEQGDLLKNVAEKGPAGEGRRGDDLEEADKEIRDKLASLVCVGQCFIVFETEADRNAAVERSEYDAGISFRGSRLTFEVADCEPASILWQNCVEQTLMWKLKKAVGGFISYVLAMLFWVFAFYAPYAYIILSSNYQYGQEPSLVANLSFTMVVVAGNGLMYYTCSEIADRMGFQSVDNREVLYMLLYTIACMLNVLLDMAVTYHMAYSMLVGIGMQTHDGRPLKEVTRFTERFESYAMQRSLGENLWAYSFPSTFLVPFLIEPAATIYLPYKIMVWIVRSHPKIHEWTAERLLTPAPMDLSRYSDVLLNAMLAVLVFYFPPGWTHWIFMAMAGSHLVIYALDHYKVLRCIPSTYFSTADVDWWAQWMLSVPIGLIMSALVFKCNSRGYIHVRGWWLILLCTASCILHMVVHTWVLLTMVPKFGCAATSAGADVQYRVCAERHPFSWFSSNPVHCLRSKYIYKQEPPCDFCIPGKEHLLRVNEKAGYFFHDKEAVVETFLESHSSWTGMQTAFKEQASVMTTGIQSFIKGETKIEEANDKDSSDSEESTAPVPKPKAPEVPVAAKAPEVPEFAGGDEQASK